MQNVIGIINSGFTNESYETLCETRPDYMLPFGSRYRIIDFSLSNLSQHNLSNVDLYAGKSIRSTLDHVGNGKAWELNRRTNGLTINPPLYENLTAGIPNEIDQYYDNHKFYEDAKAEHLYIVNPMILTKVDINKVYDEFLEHDYDVMFIYKEIEDNLGQYLNCDKLILNSEGKLINIGVNLGTESRFNFFLGKTFIKKDVFLKIIKFSKERANAATLTQAILNFKSELKIGTYGLDAHVEYIRDIASYYNANMNLLDQDVYRVLFTEEGRVLTKSKDEPTTSYREGADVSNTLLANGCILEGQVENSVLFRGVKIGKGAIVKNSILFENTEVQDGAVVVNSITDKNVTIEKSATLVGTNAYPYVVPKGSRVKRS